MRAIDVLAKQRDAAWALSKTGTVAEQQENYEFCARLCQELINLVNSEADLDSEQEEFVSLMVGNIGYQFLPDRDVKYKETATTDPLLLMQVATFINSCKSYPTSC